MVSESRRLPGGSLLKSYEKEESFAQLLILPGGAYSFCSLREMEPVALAFLKRGYSCHTLQYRCGAQSEYPKPLEDVAQALKILNAKHGNQRIFLMGFSAGGHLAALYAQRFFLPDFWEEAGMTKEDLRISGVLLAYPVVNLHPFLEDMEDEGFYMGAMFQGYAKEKDPMMGISPQMPPTFLWYTRQDTIIQAEDTSDFVTEMVKKKVKIEAHLFSEGDHALSTADAISCSDRSYSKAVGSWVQLADLWMKSLL